MSESSRILNLNSKKCVRVKVLRVYILNIVGV